VVEPWRPDIVSNKIAPTTTAHLNPLAPIEKPLDM
jgi:hypothetical protein